jgi:hypothetical protein
MNTIRSFLNSSWYRTVSKELPGSTVTETLKNRILIAIDTSKESDFYAYIKSFASEKICLNFEKRGKHPLKVIEP